MASVISGYMHMKKFAPFVMEQTGRLRFNELDLQKDSENYEEWFNNSINITGKLMLPGVDLFAREKVTKKSRIAEAL